MPTVTDPLLDSGHPWYADPKEENLKVLKLRGELKVLSWVNVALFALITFLLIGDIWFLYLRYQTAQNADLYITDFKNKLRYPFLVVDEHTDTSNLLRLPPIVEIYKRNVD